MVVVAHRVFSVAPKSLDLNQLCEPSVVVTRRLIVLSAVPQSSELDQLFQQSSLDEALSVGRCMLSRGGHSCWGLQAIAAV